jgi:hypothetical protein
MNSLNYDDVSPKDSNIMAKTSIPMEDFYKSLHFVQKEMEEKMSASALIQTMEYIIKKNSSNLKDFFVKHKAELDGLQTDKGEYVYVNEILPNNINVSRNLYHPTQGIMGKTPQEINDLLNKTLIKSEKHRVDQREILRKGWKACKNQINSRKLSSNYTIINYKWYSFVKNKPYTKRALVKIIRINGKYYLIGCGVHTEDYIEDKPGFFKRNLKLISVTLITTLLYYLRVQDFSLIGLILYLAMSLYVNHIILSSTRKPESYENELKEREELNKIAFSIGATICALIIASNILNFQTTLVKQKYQRNLLSSFAILIFAVLIQPYDNTGVAVHKTSIVQQILILITFNYVGITLFSYLFQ